MTSGDNNARGAGPTALRTPAQMRELRARKEEPSIAFDRLHGALLRDEQLFRNNGDGGNEGAFRSLLAVVAYLNEIGMPNPLLAPLMAIATALEEARGGAIAPVLGFQKTDGGRPSTPDRRQLTEGVIAAVAEGFMQAGRLNGEQLKESMNRAATCLRRNAAFGKLDGPQVENVREKVRRRIRSISHDQYASLINTPGFKHSPEAVARRIAADWLFVEPVSKST